MYEVKLIVVLHLVQVDELHLMHWWKMMMFPHKVMLIVVLHLLLVDELHVAGQLGLKQLDRKGWTGC